MERYRPERSAQVQAVPLSKQELTTQAISQFGDRFPEWQIERFVQRNVIGVKLHGTDVLSVNFEHDSVIPPIAQAYMESPRTKAVITEYFKPDLDRYNAYTGKAAKLYRLYLKGEAAQLTYARELTDYCEGLQKPIVVTDIANRPLYLGIYYAHRRGVPLASAAAALLESSSLVDNPIGIAALLSTAWNTTMALQFRYGRGIFNELNTTKLERWVTDMEQGRRLFLAKGVEQVANEYSESESNDSQVVAHYPRAHGIRMMDILISPRPRIDRMRARLYKTIAPGLDYSVRKWEHDQKDGWTMTSEKKIIV